LQKRDDVRNIAIIAHVDHGKTTLVDCMLSQSGTYSDRDEVVDRVMDSGDIERERGITILAKTTSVQLPDCRINIVDTPGHMDFGGEVERTLQMVEGFLLLVDAAEGPLPGTRFVLQKALDLNLKPLVLINKIDRPDADVERIEEKIHDLFLDIATTPEQLDFTILYGSSKNGFVSTNPAATDGDLQPLFEAIKNEIPVPTQEDDKLRVLVTNLDYSDYLGRIAVGRVLSGTIKQGSNVICCHGTDVSSPVKVIKLHHFDGLGQREADSATFGDIVSIAGLGEEVTIGTTVCNVGDPSPVDYISIDEPTLAMNFSVNTSPFAGKDGNLLTSRQIADRLEKELKTNVALRVEDTGSPETFRVLGRGQLHLAILVETMRREGFELQLSSPEVILKEIDGKKCEPVELLTIDVDANFQGVVMEMLGTRRALMQDMVPHGTKIRMEFKIPTRGLLGLRGPFLTETRGTGMMSSRFLHYEPKLGDIPCRTRGSLISMEQGKTTAFALDGLQQRGTLFVAPTTEVYEGMIIGEHSRDNDLDVNPVKGKKLTNMRASGSDDAVKVTPPKDMNLERSLDWIDTDELVEVTPNSIRLRKRFLKPNDRKRNKK
jgi:GTP-binding protein